MRGGVCLMWYVPDLNDRRAVLYVEGAHNLRRAIGTQLAHTPAHVVRVGAGVRLTR